jgi:hypothetical protein
MDTEITSGPDGHRASPGASTGPWPSLPPLPEGACRCGTSACRSGRPDDLAAEQAARTETLRAAQAEAST